MNDPTEFYTAKLFILFALVLVAAAKEPQPLALETDFGGELQLNQIDTYILAIPKAEPGKNLIIVSSGLTTDPLDTPTVVVRKGQKKWQCIQRSRADLCLIDSKELKDNDEFFIDVSCEFECSYVLKSYLSQRYKIEFEQWYTLNLTDVDTVAAETIVPKDLKFEEIGIVVMLTNAFQIRKSLSLDVTVGENSSTTQNNSTFKGQPSWNDGIAVFLGKSDVKAGDKLQLLISGSKGANILFYVHSVSNNTAKILPAQEVYGECKKGKQKTYVVDLTNYTNDPNYNFIVRLKRFSGRPIVKVSGSIDQSNSSSLLQSASYGSTTQFVINPKIRKDLNLSNIYYITITSVTDSTYSISAIIDDGGLSYLLEGQTRVSELEEDEVDNYISWATTTKSQLQYTLTYEDLRGKVDFAVRVCGLAPIQNPCDEVKSSKDKFNGINGFFHKQGDKTSFIFKVNTNSCQANGDDTKSCNIQIIFYAKDKTANISKYLVELVENSEQFELVENSGFTFLQPASRSFRFALPSIQGVQQVRFYITVISGDCELYGSSKSRSQQQSSAQQLIFTDIAKVYFLTVKCQQRSYYSIVTIVKRNNESMEEPYELFDLPFDVPQKYSMTGKGQQLRFYVATNKPFTVSVTPSRGYVWFEVVPSAYVKPIPNAKPWIPQNNRIQISSSGQEYLVIVHSQSEAYFTIMASLSTACEVGIFAKPINVKINPNQTRCFDFIVPRVSDFDIIIGSNGHDLDLNQLKVQRQISIANLKNSNLTSNSIFQTDFEALQSKSKEGQNQTVPLLHLQFSTAGQPLSFNFVVERPNQQSVLFDSQIRRFKISGGVKRIFYQLSDQSTFVVFLYHNHSQATGFWMTGKLVELDRFLKQDNLYDQTNANIHSFHTNYGYTGLTITQELIKEAKCTKCVLLMNVHGLENNTFDIEAAQSLVQMNIGQTRLGYAAQNSTKGYLIYSDVKQQRIVTLNSFVQNCFILELYKFGRDVQDPNKRVKISRHNFMTIPAGSVEQYKIQLKASEDCFYHITYTQTSRRVYEVTEGFYYDFQMNASEEVYFVYYHYNADSFRMMALVGFGGISFQAYSFGQLDFQNINSLLDRADKNYSFGGFSVLGSLKIDSSHPKFCSACYYLISAKSLTKTSASFLLHKMSTPFLVRSQKLIHQTLAENESFLYNYYSRFPFSLVVDVSYGKLQVNISAGSELIGNLTVTTKGVLAISQRLSNKLTLFGGKKSTQFLISVKATQSSSFTLQILEKRNASQLKFGTPGHFELASNVQSCFEFPVQKQSKSVYLMVLSSINTNVQPLQYKITCRYKNSGVQCPTHIISNEIADENLNIQIEADDAIFNACFKTEKPGNLTVILSSNELKFLPQKTPQLIKSAVPVKNYMSLHANKDAKVVIDIYQCKGNIVAVLGDDYMGLIRGESSNISYKSSRDSGHLVLQFNSSQQSQYYLVLNPYDVPKGGNLAKIVYNHPNSPRPEPPSRQISYVIDSANLTFKVKCVEGPQTVTYILLVSRNDTALKAASQCGLMTDFYRLKQVTNPDEKEVTIDIPRNQIQKSFKEQKYYYVTVVALHKWDDITNRIIYNSIEMTSLQPIISEMNRSFFGTWTGIFIVIIGLMICGYVFIVKKALRRIWRYINQGDLIEEDSRCPQSTQHEEVEPAVELQEKSELTVPQVSGIVGSELHAIE